MARSDQTVGELLEMGRLLLGRSKKRLEEAMWQEGATVLKSKLVVRSGAHSFASDEWTVD